MRLTIGLLATIILFSATPSHAGPIDINVVSASFETMVETRYYGDRTREIPPSVTTRTTESSSPIADALAQSFDNNFTRSSARSDAGFFSVSAETHAWIEAGSAAMASSTLLFAPVIDATGELTLDFAGYYEWYYSRGGVTLTDVTTGEDLWSFAWNGWNNAGGPHDVPWESVSTPPYSAAAQIIVSTELLASHRYSLAIRSFTGADEDNQRVDVAVHGLRRVPEPATLSLLVFGCAVALCRRVTKG